MNKRSILKVLKYISITIVTIILLYVLLMVILILIDKSYNEKVCFEDGTCEIFNKRDVEKEGE